MDNQKNTTSKTGSGDAQEKKGLGLGFWIVGGLLFAGAVTGGVILWTKSKKKKSGGGGGGSEDFPENDTTTTTPKKRPASGGGGSGGGRSNPKPITGEGSFPLRKGSKGTRVGRIQRALMAKFGRGILPKYKDDNDWGGETERAIRQAGWPSIITEKIFKDFFGNTSGSGAASSGGSASSGSGGQSSQGASVITNHHAEAWNLFNAGKKGDWTKANAILSKMKNVEDYKKFRVSFRQWKFNGLVSFSPLNAMFSVFGSGHRSELTKHFSRMGLVIRDGKWSLSGLGNMPTLGRMARLRNRAAIWTDDGLSITIPGGLVLGREIRTGGGFTRFVNGNGEEYFVHTKDVEFG